MRIRKLQCLNDYELHHRLKPYLKREGFFCFPSLFGDYHNPFLWVLVKRNDEKKLDEIINNFQEV